AGSGENPHEYWRLTTSPDSSREIRKGHGPAPRRADLPDLRVPGPRAAADLGGGLHLLRREAVAARGPRARVVRLRAVSGDVAGEAGRGPGGRPEVGGVPPEAGCPLICVPWRPGRPRGRSPPLTGTSESP